MSSAAVSSSNHTRCDRRSPASPVSPTSGLPGDPRVAPGDDDPDSINRVIPISGDERYEIHDQTGEHRMTENYFTLWDENLGTVDVLDGCRMEVASRPPAARSSSLAQGSEAEDDGPMGCGRGAERARRAGRRSLVAGAVVGLLAWLSVVAACGSASGEGAAPLAQPSSTAASESSPSARVPVRIMTFNIRWGAADDMSIDLAPVAAAITAAEADVVVLQEVDNAVGRSGGIDQVGELGRLTGLTPLFAGLVSLDGGFYGNAFLTRHPVVLVDNHPFEMRLPGEPRGAAELVIDAGGQRLRVLGTHLAPGDDSSERLLHAQAINGIVTELPGVPTVVVGDFNDHPGRRVHREMTLDLRDAWEVAGEGDGFTHPATAPRRRIDWVLVSSGVDVDGIATVDGGRSDHRAVVADLTIP